MAAVEFEREVRKLVDYFSMEFDLTYIEAVGILEMIKFDLMVDALDTTSGEDV